MCLVCVDVVAEDVDCDEILQLRCKLREIGLL
jgi:hypothetical protein